METVKLTRGLVTIWTLGIVSIATVFFTHNRLLMLPLFIYMVYKSIRGIISYRYSIYVVPFSFLLMLSFLGIYNIVLRSLSQ